MNLLPTRTVAERLHTTPATVSRWVKQGRLKYALKLEGLRGPMWFSPEDVEAFIASQAEPTEAAS